MLVPIFIIFKCILWDLNMRLYTLLLSVLGLQFYVCIDLIKCVIPSYPFHLQPKPCVILVWQKQFHYKILFILFFM